MGGNFLAAEPIDLKAKRADRDPAMNHGKNHGKTMGKWWFYGILWDLMGFNGIYPLIIEHRYGKWP